MIGVCAVQLDRKFSGTLSEQSQRTEVQLAQLEDEKRSAGQGVLGALDDFASSMHAQMSEELLRLSQAELDYHQGMVAHLQQLTATLRARQSDASGTTGAWPSADAAPHSGAASEAATPTQAASAVAPPPPPSVIAAETTAAVAIAPIQATLAPMDDRGTPSGAAATGEADSLRPPAHTLAEAEPLPTSPQPQPQPPQPPPSMEDDPELPAHGGVAEGSDDEEEEEEEEDVEAEVEIDVDSEPLPLMLSPSVPVGIADEEDDEIID